MRRRDFLTLASGMACALPLCAHAQYRRERVEQLFYQTSTAERLV
jgi:hypothetical protein